METGAGISKASRQKMIMFSCDIICFGRVPGFKGPRVLVNPHSSTGFVESLTPGTLFNFSFS